MFSTLFACWFVIMSYRSSFFAGNFFFSSLYNAPLPSCVVPACDEDLNVNIMLPPLCCSSLPFGPFVSIVNNSVDFLVPEFLGAALADPACRNDLFAKTQNTFSYLQVAQQRVSVSIFQGSGKIPYCENQCLPDNTVQINLFLNSMCAPACPIVV
jgi:hypothetical protein